MERTGPPFVLVAALQILIVLAIVGLAVYRGEQAHRNRAEGVVRARTRRAYLCFLLWGTVFVGLGLATPFSAFSSQESFAKRQGLAAFVGIALGVPAALVILVGLFHALMVWRVRLMRVLLLATATLLPLVFSDFFRDPWTSMIAAAYGLLVMGASVWGLSGLRGAPSSGGEIGE